MLSLTKHLRRSVRTVSSINSGFKQVPSVMTYPTLKMQNQMFMASNIRHFSKITHNFTNTLSKEEMERLDSENQRYIRYQSIEGHYL